MNPQQPPTQMNPQQPGTQNQGSVFAPYGLPKSEEPGVSFFYI